MANDKVIHWSITDQFEGDPYPEYTLSVCWRWLPVKKYLGTVDMDLPGFAFATVDNPSGAGGTECPICRDHTHERVDALLGRFYPADLPIFKPPWNPGG